MYTNGVLVVGMAEIEGIRPYENTGIEEITAPIDSEYVPIPNTGIAAGASFADYIPAAIGGAMGAAVGIAGAIENNKRKQASEEDEDDGNKDKEESE